MYRQAAGVLEPRGAEQRRPDHRVKLEDVLRHDLEVRRPVPVGDVLALAGEGERRHVVEQRVEPHIHPLAGVPRQRHPPLQLRPRQGHVLEPLLDERERLVVSVLRDDEVGPLRVQALQLGLERRQPEEPVLLALLLQRDLVDRTGAAGPQLALRVEAGAPGAVPALVASLVHVPVVVHPLDDLRDPCGVAGVGGADEEVVRGIDQPHHRLELAARCGRRAPAARSPPARPPAPPARRARPFRSGRTRPRRAGACAGPARRQRSSCRRARGGARRSRSRSGW